MKSLLRKISARTYISMGLVSLTTSLLFLAFFFGMVPDHDRTVREGRAALAESVAAFSTSLISQDQTDQLRSTLGFLIERNPDLVSAAVRTQDGEVLASWGDHAAHWRETAGAPTGDAQLRVPIFAGDQPWGSVELAFRPLKPAGLTGLLYDSRVHLVVFVAGAGFLLFFFYLGRMLKHLDPSRAVPERVRSALDTLTEGLLVMDTKGQIVLANQAFSDLLGLEHTRLTGVGADTLAWEDSAGDKPAADSYPWQQALHSGQPSRNSLLWFTGPDGKRRTFMVNCSPILVGKGEYGGVMVSLDDVTLLEEKEIELVKSRKEAESANRAKSEFLANMSHEIRSPMNAILGFTELLRRGQAKNEAEHHKHLDIVHASGTHLLGLINDILDLSKVEAGRLEVEQIDCSPYQIASEVVQLQGVKAAEKRIEIALECAGLIPERIVTDPARFRQILTNLVGNAIKFTEAGGVKVRLRFEASRPIAGVQVEVIDSGIGIPGDKLETIFEPFTQAEGSITRRFGGTGLGLTISRSLARALGGDLAARNALGGGSIFTLTLPAGPIEAIRLLTPEEITHPRTGESAAGGTRWKLPGVRILIVDDGEENRELVRLVLEDAGALTEQAENGQIALDKAQTLAYDLILMDLQMPVMDGETATRHLRRQGIDTPVVALTAHAMKGFEQDVLSAGFTAYLTKPIDLDRLMATVAGLTRGTRVERELKKPDAVPIQSYKAGSDPRAPVVSRLAGNARLRPAVDKFVNRLHSQIDAIDRAWRDQDFDALSDLSHWLKGAAGTVGFDAFTEPARKLEQLAKMRTETGMGKVVSELHDLTARIELPAVPHRTTPSDTTSAPAKT